ncbi:unnamed protein product [Bursaphelenchus xylophilus]|uniref:(pine wood nematode) hypothetical protein n=1 Tax=Bursaphelenchus xylophilus TaxID=6326 RepID=A0A1I7RM49_BURXY|nr:unnamed protein product [Bursaphelenchus xylophilus]CAG9118205.1 unnamed protein product [Bursaphelenchus xylophilus]
MKEWSNLKGDCEKEIRMLSMGSDADRGILNANIIQSYPKTPLFCDLQKKTKFLVDSKDLRVKCPDHHVEQVYNSVGPEIAVNLPPVETEGGGINVNVQYHPPNGSQWHLDRPLIVNVSVIDENGSQAWCQFSYMAETADCPSWQINSRYKCTQKSNITICSASVCPTREIPPNIQELVCVPGHGWRILEENIDSTSITHLGSAPKMQSAPICVSEMMSSVTLVLNYQLSNADWQCSRDFLERIRSKMSQFLEEQCTDVGWTYSGADMANASKLGLNFTTHNRDTPAVLGCIDSITGHVPLIPPPCPNSGVRRNTTKYHLRCPTGWGANNRLRCEKCPPGYHVDNESCAPCPRGTYNVNPEFTDCIACPEGQTTLSDAAMGEHMCVAQCPPGFFSRRSGLAPCSPCPQGTYQPDSGQEGCLSCGDGLTTTELGTKDVNDCRSQCLTGFYSPYGVEPCEPCPIGHYNEGEGSMMCHRCPPGFTTASVGSTGPNECRVSSCSSAGCSNRGECLGDICKCDIGFTGNTCDVPFNLCNASFCLNNGVCNFNENDGSFCTCSEGFSGRRCEIDMAKMTQRFKRKAGRWSSSSSQSWHQSSWFNSSSTGDTESPEIRFAPTTKAKTTLIPRTTTRHRPHTTIPTTTQTPVVTTESVATTLGTTSQQIIPISASSQTSVDGYCQLNDCYDGKCSSEANICNCNDGFKRDGTLKRCIQDKSCRNLGICVKNNTKEVDGDWDTGKW